jgi:hypothetical protein
VGLFAAARLATRQSERYAEDVLAYARFVHAKERATLVRLLEEKDVRKAQELLYFVLGDNFKDYENDADSEARARACELYKRLGPGFVGASTQPAQSQTRQALVQSIRSATAKCDADAK